MQIYCPSKPQYLVQMFCLERCPEEHTIFSNTFCPGDLLPLISSGISLLQPGVGLMTWNRNGFGSPWGSSHLGLFPSAGTFLGIPQLKLEAKAVLGLSHSGLWAQQGPKATSAGLLPATSWLLH